MTNLANTKTSLAKLLAGENITVQHKKVRTAGFDIKNRVLVLPMYKKDISPEVYDTFVAHEVGHALYSNIDSELFKDRALFRYVNLVEDIRIERMIKAKFPGLVKSFYLGYQQLKNDNFFGVKDSEIEGLCFGDRLNLNAKIGSNGYFTEEEEVLAEKARKVITMDDVIEVAKEIQAYDKQAAEEEEKEEKSENQENQKGEGDSQEQQGKSDKSDESGEEGQNSMESDEDGEGEEGDDSSSDGDASESDDLSGEAGDDKTESGSEGENADQNSKKDADGDKESDEASNGGGSVESEGGKTQDLSKKPKQKEMVTDENADQKYDNFLDDSPAVKEPKYYEVGDILLNKIIEDTKSVNADLSSIFGRIQNKGFDNALEEFNKFKMGNQKVVNYLHKEFEMRKNAEQQKRAAESTSGSLDTTRMFKYKYDENIFKKVTSVPNGKSHGLVMYLDWSGSMENKIMDTVKQMINLVLFCKRAGIEFEVYAFAWGGRKDQLSVNDITKNLSKDQITVGSEFRLINFLSSKLSGAKLNEALLNVWKLAMVVSRKVWLDMYHNGAVGELQKYSLTGTPLNQALLIAPKVIEKFRHERKVQVVHMTILTDGEATDHLYSSDNGVNIRSINTEHGYLRHGHKYHSIKVGDGSRMYGRGSSTTVGLLNYVKEVSKVNIIGFFLVGAKYELSNVYMSHKFQYVPESLSSKFGKEGNVVIEDAGYDELYVIKTDRKNFGIESENAEEYEFKDIKEAMKDVKKQFNAHGNSVKKQRVILNKFIAKISNPKIMF